MPKDFIEWTDATGRKWSMDVAAEDDSIGAPEVTAMRAEPLSLRDQYAHRVMVKGPSGIKAQWLTPPAKGRKLSRPVRIPQRGERAAPCLCGTACGAEHVAEIGKRNRGSGTGLDKPDAPGLAPPTPAMIATRKLVERMVVWYGECTARAAQVARRERLLAKGFKLAN